MRRFRKTAIVLGRWNNPLHTCWRKVTKDVSVAAAELQKGGGALAPSPWKCCKVFCCISSYSKTLSRPIIYALFSQFVVSFWGLCPRRYPTGAPPLDPAGGLKSPDSLICPLLKKILQTPMCMYTDIEDLRRIHTIITFIMELKSHSQRVYCNGYLLLAIVRFWWLEASFGAVCR